MGKFERGKVREAEIILTKLLNGETLSREEKRHELFKCVLALKQKIKQDYPEIRKANHVGDTYTSPGNIELILKDGRKVYIEVKFVSGGRGTRANISQDALTDLGLFEDAISWSCFREQKAHDKWVMEILDKFKNYPSECSIGTDRQVLEQKARYLKNNILHITGGCDAKVVADKILRNRQETSERKLAAQIIMEIMARDRQEKIEYINYLRTRRQNPDNIKKFAFLLLMGAHSRQAIKKMWHLSLNQIIKMSQAGSYRVYYVNKRTLNVDVEELTEKLNKLMDKELFIMFKENETNVIIAFKDGEDERPILRIVFHWKNIFQGIKTPCLNIFDEAWLAKDP